MPGDDDMCDTITVFDNNNKASFFGKNSDRDPEELQILYISHDPEKELYSRPFEEEITRYIDHPFQKLKEVFKRFDNKYQAIISRPVWIWGAEMGVNEYGLSIGNEAVFSKEKTVKDGLLGMDILRLALHNNKTAKQATDFIVDLIEEYNQSGDGMYSGKLHYHNSYLIKDFKETFILETAGKHWAIKNVKSVATISNSYTINNDYNRIDKKSNNDRNFKEQYENRLLSYFSGGDYRQDFSSNYLFQKKPCLKEIMKLFRSHKKGKSRIQSGMKSICMHPGFLKTETTGSMIVEYREDKFVTWFTGSPHPCLSLYKPVTFPVNEKKSIVTDIDYALHKGKQWKSLAKYLLKNYRRFVQDVKPLRDELEDRFIQMIDMNSGRNSKEKLLKKCQECYRLIDNYQLAVEKVI